MIDSTNTSAVTPSALWQEAVVLFSAGQLLDAEALLSRAVRRTQREDLGRAPYLQVLGRIRAATGRTRGAVGAFDACLRLLADHAIRSCCGDLDTRRSADARLGGAVDLSMSLAMLAPTPATLVSALHHVWVRKALAPALRRNELLSIGSAFPSLPDFRRELPSDGLLIEMARYSPINFLASPDRPHLAPARYAAFALRGWGAAIAPLLTDLGSAEDIEDMIAGAREELSGVSSYEGGFATLSVAEARRLLDTAPSSTTSEQSASTHIAFIRSHQRVDRATTIDSTHFRKLLAGLEHHHSSLSLGDVRMRSADASSQAVSRDNRPTQAMTRIGRDSRSLSRDLTTVPAGEEQDPNAGFENVQALGRRLLGPFARWLQRTRHIVAAPDGDLWLIPFAALYDDARTPLLTRADVTVVDHGFDLAVTAPAAEVAAHPLVIADPALRRSPTTRVAPSFAQLPGAYDEGKAVAALLGTTCYTGEQATDTLVRGARSPIVLHLATHGFALPDRRPGGLSWASTDGLHGLSLLASMSDPNRRAGLALAGAADWAAHGQTLPGPGDGLLLAADVANLNLAGTALVVLSACETGVGQVAAGDTTWSLARAFRKAGARAVVMSLWRVPDQSTRLLMERFYGAFLNGDAPAQALRHAQMAVMAAGMPPRHWAAFTCWDSGGLRSLARA